MENTVGTSSSAVANNPVAPPRTDDASTSGANRAAAASKGNAGSFAKYLSLEVVPLEGPLAETIDLSELPDDGDFSVRGKQIKVGLRPVADEAQMLLRPIFQSPTDPNAPHPKLKQPAGLARKNVPESYLVQNDSALRKVFSEALPGIDAMLKNPALRREKEEKYFTIVDQISPEHRRADTQFAKTLGIRGVVAKEDIPAGTALIYSAQYLSASEWK